jgi:hypothetical protein
MKERTPTVIGFVRRPSSSSFSLAQVPEGLPVERRASLGVEFCDLGKVIVRNKANFAA